MPLISSAIVFILFTAGLFLLMRRHVFEILLGTMLMSHGVNLLLLSMGGWVRDQKPPLLIDGTHLPSSAYADPIPQALILTAIVIGFGVTAFLVVLLVRGFEENESEEFGEMTREEGEA
jgi:multicomponent Na+:H+ antiporter subunit C